MNPADNNARCRHGFKDPRTCAHCLDINVAPRDPRVDAERPARRPAERRDPSACPCGARATRKTSVHVRLHRWCDACRKAAISTLRARTGETRLAVLDVVAELRHREHVARGKRAWATTQEGANA